MMKTRRKSKAEAAAHEDGDEDSHSLNLFVPDDIDLDALSDLLPDINTASPSSEAIISIYRLLLAQASDVDAIQRDLDEARAEAERKDIELDQALQDRESLSKELEVSLESAHEEVNKIKQERDQLVVFQGELQAQVAALSNSKSTSSSEVDTLKHRVEDTEREKRDLVGVISRLKQEGTQREEEIQTLRANLKDARHEHQALEAQVRELRSVETSTKFKLDSLTQQLQLSQAETERTNAELTTKSEEFSKHRRTKHAELATLQASYDSLTQNHAATQASLKALQSAHTAQAHQLTQALTRVQDLTGQLAEQEATYASEASGLRRLVGMMEEREKQAKEVVEAIERDWAEVGEKAERRENSLRNEMERERRGREDAEKRAEQLESVLSRMGRGELPGGGWGTPGTPLRTPGTPDAMTDGMIGLSPTVAMVSRAQRTGKTFTEVYADYVRLQDDFAKKSAEYDHMDRTLSAVLSQIEERAPILSQQRAEYERLQSEASQLASQLAQALSDRDSQANIAQDNSQKLSKSTRENELLQKQLEDLGRQVQALLREIGRRDDPTIPSDEDLEGVSASPAEDTEAVITNNLVLFKSIGGLQEQNQKLLKIVRELGRKMESEEKEYRDAMEKEQGEAVREAHEAMQELAAQLERQKKSSEGVIQAYVKERDALRGMLARAEKLGGGVPGSAEVNGIREHTGPNGTSNVSENELVEMRSQFDAYRMEMGVDSERLREDLISAQREVGQLGAALAKANARIEYLSDRHRMNQEQFSLHGREIDDLTKRNQQLFDQWTRIDIECSRASEDLQIAHGRIEQLRNESANLRAEKKIWESVQGRLVEENKTLAMERSHLSDLMGNVQKMHNDLERSGENDRRRLENQLQMLEGQTQDLRTQVSQERDAVRHITLQKDIELKELQSRMERSTQELSKTREAMIGAETSKKHLEERVEELTRSLQGNEEKLAVYERRSSGVNGVAQNVDQDMSREQQLEAEVAELRSALKVTEVDLASARSHVQQFQEISQANEEALANLNGTYDEYKASTEAQIARHELEYKSLQDKLQSAQDELAQLTSKYNELQKTLETERIAWLGDKKTLEDTIVDMSTSEKHSESDRTSRENEVRQQEERAKAAEERYSHEVIAHADSIKSIEALKQELSSVRASARDNLTAAETAKANLATSESSWSHQKAALDKEIADLNTRCADLSSQNTILHQHLESVSTQAARIRQAADSSSADQSKEGEATEDTDTKLSELRAVVAYLRKEKEIVELQLELSRQETTRFKAQIDHLSQTLDDTRATLSQERERAVETAASASQHAELIERINQLNILRESNATLRADCENSSKRARDLETKLAQLSEQLEPAKEEGRVARAELEALKMQLKRLEEENRRWQERNTQLLSKYDRIDPAEMQALKDEIETLKSQKAELEQHKMEQDQAHEATKILLVDQIKQHEALQQSMRNHLESGKRNMTGFRNKLGELNASKSALTEEKRQLEAKIVDLESKNAKFQTTVETLEREKSANPGTSSEDASNQVTIINALREERDKLIQEKATWISGTGTSNASGGSTDEAKQNWESEKIELTKSHDDAVSKLKAATEQAQKAANEMRALRMQNEKYMARINDLMKSKVVEGERQAAAVSAAVEKTKTELQASSASPPNDLVKKHAEELRTLRAQLTAKHQNELKIAVEAAQKEAAQRGDTNPANDAGQKAIIDAAIAEHEKQLKALHVEEIASAVERGRMEQAAKGKLKDSQLVKAQKRVKELEAQLLELRNTGTSPITTTGPTSINAVPGPSTAAVSQASTSINPPPIVTTPTSNQNVTATGTLPRKPSMGTPTGPNVGVGRGAGAARGARPARGGAPVRTPPVKPAAAAVVAAATTAAANTTGGVSIMGAAQKRGREESQTSSDDSLAKRLKPAEPVGKPVILKRPPPGP